MGFAHWLGDSPRCSQNYHNRSPYAPVRVIRDPSYSKGRPECPPRVWFSPEIYASNVTLRLLSHTLGGSQWQKYSLLMHCPETSLQSLVSPNTNENHARRHLWTLHAPEAPREVYFSTRVFSCACSSSVHLRSIRCALSFGIRMSGFPLASFDSDDCLIIHGSAIWIIQCAASCWASLSLVQIACIKLFTAEYNASAPCFSYTVSSSEASGAPGNSHIVW